MLIHFFIGFTLISHVLTSDRKPGEPGRRGPYLALPVLSGSLPNGRYKATKGNNVAVCHGLANLSDFVMDVTAANGAQVANITATVEGKEVHTKGTIPLMWHSERGINKLGEHCVDRPNKCFGFGTRSDDVHGYPTVGGVFMKDLISSLDIDGSRVALRDIIFCKSKQDVVAGL
ncbi:hypothetical protein FOL47_000756 [Perkinsus chesapeaki]|uniref:Uncharacterized protein n=1 Tax=Perkinsus chesapeaki TaxID=330153 RepID=A0A7J6MKW6_PERCH|nr:hypothetical protein FOL47_000756 [Perkinsus chesapeaki]